MMSLHSLRRSFLCCCFSVNITKCFLGSKMVPTSATATLVIHVLSVLPFLANVIVVGMLQISIERINK